MSAKKTILSGSTATGDLTLGNYIGAINNWTKLQEEYDCFYFVADLHALTVKQDPKILRERCMSFFAQYIALGLDPEKKYFILSSLMYTSIQSWLGFLLASLLWVISIV